MTPTKTTPNSTLPLVSAIVTTRNNHATLTACLESIKNQTYSNIELVVVDRDSTDDTKDIARRYTSQVFNKGPERCAQRNFAVQQAHGQYVLIIDSDMELSPGIIAACVKALQQNPAAKGVIIPEESFGIGFWAQCKRLERSYYVGIDWIEAARFFERQTFLKVGAYNEQLVSGEDWELSQRIGREGPLLRINQAIRHNEGHLHLFKTLRKKAYYAQEFRNYLATTKVVTATAATHGSLPLSIVLKRYWLFLSKPRRLFRQPHIGLGVLIMKTCEFGFGGVGYLLPKKDQS